jgi:hypothetical protein
MPNRPLRRVLVKKRIIDIITLYYVCVDSLTGARRLCQKRIFRLQKVDAPL